MGTIRPTFQYGIRALTSSSVMTFNCRSTSLITQLLTQLDSLGNGRPVLHRIYLYMLCATKYKITKVVVGQSPYGPELVPTLGAIYSQQSHTTNTSTLAIIARHFSKDVDLVTEMFKHSWRLLTVGYLFVN